MTLGALLLTMDLLEQTLVCSVCREALPTTFFSRRSDRPRGYTSRCKKCIAPARAAQGYRKQVLARRGLTEAQYSALLEAQGGVCKSCKGPQNVGGLRSSNHFDVDHDHVTGLVRGLLCRSCNVILGHAKDDPARLRALASYLENS